MFEPIFTIGGHMIRSRIFKTIGDVENANEEIFEVGLLVEIDGYHEALKSDDHKKPSYLDTYPELRTAWEHGYEQGTWARANHISGRPKRIY